MEVIVTKATYQTLSLVAFFAAASAAAVKTGRLGITWDHSWFVAVADVI